MKINGTDIGGYKAVAFDGCHKLYLLGTDRDVKDFVKLDYEIHGLQETPALYTGSCPLRFIDCVNDCEITTLVRQCCEQVVFDGFNLSDFSDKDFGIDIRIKKKDGRLFVEYEEPSDDEIFGDAV